MSQLDFEFAPLQRSLAALDRELDEIEPQEPMHPEEMDMLGIFDDRERCIGQGFVLCQMYMTSRHRGRGAWSACGRRHGAYYIAGIIEAAANFKKHHEEWPWPHDEMTAPRIARVRTIPMLKALDVWGTDYKLTSVLHVITGGLELVKLIPLLEAWREALGPGGYFDVGGATSSASDHDALA